MARNLLVPCIPILAAILAACAVRQHTGNEKGAKAPDFTLTNVHGGGKVTLSQVTKDKPVLIVFYLGYSCPRCVAQLRELAGRIEEFHKIGVEILAISPDTVAESKDSIATYGDFPFPMLSDPDMKVARTYGLVTGEDTMFHGVFVVDTQGVIRFAEKSSHPYMDSDALLAQLKTCAMEQP